VSDDTYGHHLWDKTQGFVPGGINWAKDTAETGTPDSLIGVTGPELDRPEAS